MAALSSPSAPYGTYTCPYRRLAPEVEDALGEATEEASPAVLGRVDRLDGAAEVLLLSCGVVVACLAGSLALALDVSDGAPDEAAIADVELPVGVVEVAHCFAPVLV